MTKTADVTVAEVIEVARKKRALLTPETAGYLVLEAVDQVAGTPVLVDEFRCGMQIDGGRVTILSRRTAHPVDAERGLRLLLRKLLEVAGGRAPALSAVAAQSARGDLGAFLAELESALIPVNRGAAARALSRLARETLRERNALLVSPDVAPPGDPPEYAAPPPRQPYAPPPEYAAPPPREPYAVPSSRDDEIAASRSAGDDTEPMPVGSSPELPAEPRDAFDSIERHVEMLEPSLPHFPLEGLGEGQANAGDNFEFAEEPTTSRREALSEAEPARSPAGDVQRLLDDCMPPESLPDEVRALPPPTPPPVARTPFPSPVLPAPTPPPTTVQRVHAGGPGDVISDRAAPSTATPLPPAAVANEAPSPLPPRVPPSDPVSSSFPPTSARGVDELLQDFLSSTSRKQDRVTEDLRRLAGVESIPEPKAKAKFKAGKPSAPHSDSPFPNATGATDFYTSTPPARAVTSLSPEITNDITNDIPHDIALPPKRRGTYVALVLVTLVALGGVALFRFEPGFLSGRTPTVVEEERKVAALAASVAAANPPQACRATVVVSDVPQGAEVLIRAGVAPVDVERVPSGARLEFVALSEGYTPRRAVVPQGAAWEAANGKPRFELPIQLEKSRAKTPGGDPWPATEPGTIVGGQGAPGTVHVVTSPRGAEVWMVAGGGPEAKFESMPCNTAMELLVAGTQQGQPLRRRLRLEASQLVPESSGHTVTARISAAK